MFYETMIQIAKQLREGLGVPVLVGNEKMNPICVEKEPFILLNPGSSGISFAETNDADEISIDIDFGLYDESMETDEDVRICNGLKAIDSMAERIRDILRSSLPGFYISEGSYYASLEQFPLFLGGMTIVYRNDGFTNF